MGARLALVLGLVAIATVARADAPSLDDLLRHAEALRGDDAAARERAYRFLSTLPEEAIPAIDERIRQTRAQILPEEDGYDALRAFRHATGSLRADDMVDIAPGILPALAEERTATLGRTAERLLYMRSLEGIGTTDAQVLIGDILALTPRMWRWERRRLVERHGASLLPGLLVLRNHSESPVRVWARWAIEELGLTQPADALQQEDPMLVARLLRAYGASRDMDSMQVVISFVGHPAAPIRDAAREAMASFGHNGIWQLREGMRNQLGRDADLAWGWERTARELYEGLDAARLEPLEEVLAAGLEAAESGDVATATTKLDEVLVAAPLHPRRADIARAYLALAEVDEARHDAFVRRAGLLAPDEPEVRAAVRLMEAEADLARGVLDADAWRIAARAGHPRAREVVADLLEEELPELPEEPESAAPVEVPWTWLGALALLLVGLVLAWRYRSSLRGRLPALRLPRVPALGRFGRRWAPTLRRLRARLVPRGLLERAKRPARVLAKLRQNRPEKLSKKLRLRDRLLAMGVVRRLALFERLIRGRKPTPRPKISAKEVVRRRYTEPEPEPAPRPKARRAPKPEPKRPVPKVEPRFVDCVPPKPAAEPEPEPSTGLDALLLGGAPPAPTPARPVDAHATFRSPPPRFDEDARPAAPDLASLVIGAPNEPRADRSSPGTLAAPAFDDDVIDLADAQDLSFVDASDTLAEPSIQNATDTLRE
ncbi:MAG: hypothetical protein CMN30_27095 [Sandaracinus sp.]|nr:hypothetical protein [Sandaracinus sp.]